MPLYSPFLRLYYSQALKILYDLPYNNERSSVLENWLTSQIHTITSLQNKDIPRPAHKQPDLGLFGPQTSLLISLRFEQTMMRIDKDAFVSANMHDELLSTRKKRPSRAW